MEKDLKDYLEKLSGNIDNLTGKVDSLATELAEVKATMVTKDELAEVKATMATLATKDELAEVSKDLKKMDRKFTKKFDGILEYVQDVDQKLSDHRKNTEVHNAGLRGA
ncbi:MAG: hypothetical protein HZA22_00505 [Nitrospirae bacterium]|nr:hypothetical protein [Nitrospirota bacterium]MBI5694519.1 hypothetical protein [Nitrospirota bacterium]